MERFAKLATPATAATVVVPDSVPPPALVPMATVTLALELVTVLAKASWTETWAAGAIETPATALVGWTLTASLEAAAGTMLKADEVAPVSAPEAAANV